MKNLTKVIQLVAFSILIVSCSGDEIAPSTQESLEIDLTSNSKDLTGQHFNLNIIGVKEKSMNDIAAGNVIFVHLYGESAINLQEGDDFVVLDKNGTDEDGALFQLPDPGFEPYVTELPYGFDTTTDYSVYARPLGKPMTSATITTIAELSELAELIEGRRDARLWDNLVDEYGWDHLSISWGEFIPNPVEFERLRGKQEWQNVTAELLSVVYELDVIVDEDGDFSTTDDQEVLMFHVRIPIFDDLLEGEYWKYNNNGLKLLQLRFYPFGTDVTYDDIANGWD